MSSVPHDTKTARLKSQTLPEHIEFAQLPQEYFVGSRHASSLIPDDELEALCIPLEQSVCEEQDERFACEAIEALKRLQLGDDPDGGNPRSSYLDYTTIKLPYSYARSYASSSSSGYGTPSLYSGSLSRDESFEYGGFSPSSPFTPSSPVTRPRTQPTSPAHLSLSPYSFSPPPLGSARRAAEPETDRPRLRPTKSLLETNFSGLKVRASSYDGDHELEVPTSPRLKTRRSTGFAF